MRRKEGRRRAGSGEKRGGFVKFFVLSGARLLSFIFEGSSLERARNCLALFVCFCGQARCRSCSRRSGREQGRRERGNASFFLLLAAAAEAAFFFFIFLFV